MNPKELRWFIQISTSMLYTIKLHYLSDFDYGGRDALAEAYNEALKSLGKKEVAFFDERRNEFTESMYEDGIEYEENDIYEKTFNILGYQEIGDNNYYVVQINFIDLQENEIDEFREYFLAGFKERVQFVYKFEDSRFLEIRKGFFEDIYRIEMRLREAMSFMFFTVYYDSGDFLKEFKVNDITEKLGLSQEDLRSSLENEFFYISFKDYRNLLELKPIIKEKEIAELIIDSKSFDDWKRRITERGIREEPYIAFIESIKKDLESLERFRNAIMHNHHFDLRLKKNYEKSRNAVLEKTGEFLNKHVHISGNWYSLIPGKEYMCTWQMKHFEKGKKYRLAKVEFGDYYFVGDDGEEHWFRDKEFLECFSY